MLRPHDFEEGPAGRCTADQGDGSPCGRGEDADIHQVPELRTASGLRRKLAEPVTHAYGGPVPAAAEPVGDVAQRQALRRRPWAELPAASRAILLFLGGGVGVVFAAAVASAARWILDIGGWL